MPKTIIHVMKWKEGVGCKLKVLKTRNSGRHSWVKGLWINTEDQPSDFSRTFVIEVCGPDSYDAYVSHPRKRLGTALLQHSRAELCIITVN
jgi:hypothetical protein